MGIDVVFVDREEGEEWTFAGDPERIGSVDAFLNLVLIFGHMLNPVREMVEGMRDHDTVGALEGLEEFELYIEEDRELYQAKFDQYHAKISEMTRNVLGEHPGETIQGGWFLQVPIENYETDARVFFGRLVLSGRVIEPHEAGRVIPVIGLVLGMMNHFVGVYEQRDRKTAEGLSLAYLCLNSIRKFIDAAAADEKGLYFSV